MSLWQWVKANAIDYIVTFVKVLLISGLIWWCVTYVPKFTAMLDAPPNCPPCPPCGEVRR